ncbi:MAG: hypothetical protein DCC53_08545 [Chloroflexi bacterium]|nr:MAG: hypothetical protein DCC53_08545 [Chloroflexota bacterium]
MLRQAVGWLLDLLYPPACAHCQRIGAAWCESCRGRLDSLGGSILVRELTPNVQAVAAHKYDGLIRDAVLAFKFQRAITLAETLAAHIAATITAASLPHSVIVSSPSHPDRVRWRGYDHIALLAESVANRTGLPYVYALSHPDRVRWRGYDHIALLAESVANRTGLPYVYALKRTAWRGPQVGRDAAERRRAVQTM